jgi:hypothetical protein
MLKDEIEIQLKNNKKMTRINPSQPIKLVV